jgi:hypothetical protein
MLDVGMVRVRGGEQTMIDWASATPGRGTRPDLLVELSRELRSLARSEEREAADEASTVPYWLPSPPSVAAHIRAAQTLHDVALRLEGEARAW